MRKSDLKARQNTRIETGDILKYILLRSDNLSATEFYYDIIRDALAQSGDLIFDGLEGEALPEQKDALVVVGSCMSMLHVWKQGYRNVATWFQGILPEESYMRNHSWYRMKILNRIEKFALKNSKKVFFVSEAMRKHYEKKYRLEITNAYVMPCFNTEYHPEKILSKDYSEKIFTYTGGLSAWQCIDQTLKLYKRIEERSGNTTKLLLLTPEKEKAEQMVQAHQIQNAEIKYVHYSELSQALEPVSFGFALREDNPVNRVATPTKLANYLANGIIPIYSECICDFAKQSQDHPLPIMIKDVNQIADSEVDRILKLLDQERTGVKIHSEFKGYFEQYYNAKWHQNQIAEWITRDA